MHRLHVLTDPRGLCTAGRVTHRHHVPLQCHSTGTIRGGVEVSAVDPLASMQAIDNPELGSIAGQVRDKLKKVITAL